MPALKELEREVQSAANRLEFKQPKKMLLKWPKTRFAFVIGTAVIGTVVLSTGLLNRDTEFEASAASDLLNKAADAQFSGHLKIKKGQFTFRETFENYHGAKQVRRGSNKMISRAEMTTRREWSNSKHFRFRERVVWRSKWGRYNSQVPKNLPEVIAQKWQNDKTSRLVKVIGHRIEVGGYKDLDQACAKQKITPKQLYARILEVVEGSGRSNNGSVFEAIIDAFNSGGVRSAEGLRLLLQTAALVPGIQRSEIVKDRLGRSAVRVGYQEQGEWEQRVLLLEATTLRFLGSQDVVSETVGTVPEGDSPATTQTVDPKTRRTVKMAYPANPKPKAPPGTVVGESLVMREAAVKKIDQVPVKTR